MTIDPLNYFNHTALHDAKHPKTKKIVRSRDEQLYHKGSVDLE